MVQVTIIGNLGKDAEIKKFGDNEWITFSLASTEKNSKGEQNTQWFSCYKFRGNGNLIEYLKTGTEVCVIGNLTTKVSENEKGKFINLNVNVDKLKLLSSKAEAKQDQSNQLKDPVKVESDLNQPGNSLPF